MEQDEVEGLWARAYRDLIEHILFQGFIFPSDGKTLKEQVAGCGEKIELAFCKAHTLLQMVNRLEGARMDTRRSVRRLQSSWGEMMKCR